MELAFYLFWLLIASSMVEWIWELISEVERELRLLVLSVFSPDSTRAA